jgi:hypothetical protein
LRSWIIATAVNAALVGAYFLLEPAIPFADTFGKRVLLFGACISLIFAIGAVRPIRAFQLSYFRAANARRDRNCLHGDAGSVPGAGPLVR